MSSQEDKESTLPRTVAPARKSTLTKKKERENRNTKTFFRSKGTQKEKPKLKYKTKSEEYGTMQRIDSGICGLTGKRSLNEKLKVSTSQAVVCDITDEFQMLQLHCDESNEDSLSMISMHSLPSSRNTVDLQGELYKRNFKDDDELESLENFSGSESGQMRITTEENSQGGISTDLVSDNNGSPRLQVSQLNTKEDLDKLETGNRNSSNLAQESLEFEKESEPEMTTKSKVKTAWELSDKFHLTTDFPADVWDDRKTGKKLLSMRRLSSELLSESFPPLSAVAESRRGSFPTSFSNWFSSTKTPSELPTLSGRQCKVQLPLSFPGVPPPTSESESEFSDVDLDMTYLEQEKIAKNGDQKLLKNYLEVLPEKQGPKRTTSSARASPSSSESRSPMASSEHLAMKAASAEYLAARVVTQLHCAFKETVGESDEEFKTRANCVTPNLMSRRHSALFFRSNTNFFNEKAKSLILPSVHNEYSKSLPNLNSQDKTKRMFVTFDKQSPRVKVVNLKEKTDLARKCRLINRRLANEDSVVKAMLEDKVHKKSMVKKWVISSAQGI